jgi:MoaA/NifB/PqqE/SkfB family radical SAM enzyme
MRNSRVVMYYMFDRKGRTPFRDYALLDLTYSCNLQCKMCPQAEDRHKGDSIIKKNAQNLKPLSQQEWSDVIIELAQIGCKNIVFSGGEPFLVSFLPDLIIMARKMRVRVIILTNGMLINEKMANLLVDQYVSAVNISLEGPEEIDNQVKGNAKSYARAISALDLINTAKKQKKSRFPSLCIVPTLLSINYKYLHFLPEIANKFNASINISILQFFSNAHDIIKFSNDKGEERILPSYLREIEPQDFKQSWRQFISVAKKYNVNINIFGKMTYSEIIKWYTDPNYVYSKKCLAPWSSINIEPYGRMLTCAIGKSVGNVRDHSLEELLNCKEYCDFRKELRMHGNFKFCTHCCQLSNPLWTYIPRFA